MSTALTTYTPEQQALLAHARAQNNSQSFTPRIPDIKLAPANKDIAGVEKGHYYLTNYDSDTKKKTYKDIGKNPNIVILKKAATYSYFSDKLNRLVAWTSDVEGYTENHQVVLYKDDGQNKFVEWEGNYKQFKEYVEQNYSIYNPADGTKKKLLEFQTVLYVIYEGEVYRMFVKNTGLAGVAEGAKNAELKKPQLLSLTHYLDISSDRSGDAQSAACFESVCELDSKLIKGDTIDYYIMQFKLTDLQPDLPLVLDIYGRLLKDLKALAQEDLERMRPKSPVKADVVEPTYIGEPQADVISAEEMIATFD